MAQLIASAQGRSHIVISLILVSIAVLLVFVLLMTNRITRRSQRVFSNRSAAAQLRRTASHTYKMARAAKTYALHDAVVLLLLQETARVLNLALKLDPDYLSTRTALLECNAVLASFDEKKHEFNTGREPVYPESELLLLNVQMHLTETSRLLNSMKKRRLISPELHQAIAITLQYAQRALELRLSSRKDSLKLRAEQATGIEIQRQYNYLQANFSH